MNVYQLPFPLGNLNLVHQSIILLLLLCAAIHLTLLIDELSYILARLHAEHFSRLLEYGHLRLRVGSGSLSHGPSDVLVG